MRLHTAALASALLLSTPASAQILSVKASDFDVRVGGAVTYAPDYLGSDDYELGFQPDAELSFQKVLFLSTRNGAGVYIFNDHTTRFGVGLAPNFGREESDNSRLNGLGDIDFGGDLNIFLEGNFEPFSLGMSGRVGVLGDAVGTVISVYAGYRQPITEQLTGRVRTTLSWADDRWTEDYFGINAAQSAASGLPVFDTSDGISTASVSAGLSYAITPSVSLTGTARYTRLLGDAADSPITDSADQLSFLLGAAYSWPGLQ
jgi:outer membrane scaffolding protein for murein synthesis (MipA/OmpV family)